MHGDREGERHDSKTSWRLPRAWRGMGVPVEEGDRTCSTVVSADERQSSLSYNKFVLISPRRHWRNDFILNFARSKHPSDKIIEIIHPTIATSTQGKGTTGKGDNVVCMVTFTHRHPSSSICWAEAVDESVLGSIPMSITSRTAGSIWGTTPPWLITTLPSNLFNLELEC